jgi:hypothetical protein
MTDTAPAEQDFTIYQGQNWSAIFRLFSDAANTVPFDGTDCEIDMHIREGVYDSDAPVILAASTRATGDGAGRIRWLSYASDNSVDEEGGAYSGDGVFIIELTAAMTTALIPAKKPRKGGHETSEFIYDVEVVDADGGVVRILKGVITLDHEVTNRG